MNEFFSSYGRPIEVSDGLRARSRRGAIGQSWWSERFLEVLKSSLGTAGRLDRGKHYARRGQVIDLDVRAGEVRATVQGSRARPYRVRLKLTVFDAGQWAEVEDALAGRAWYSAKLLAGEMPEDIEEVFAAVGLDLFPANRRDLSMSCSCPDAAEPCKHLAAVCYLLAESFDDDPFAILAWRGRAQAELLENLRGRRGADAEPEDVTRPATPLREELGAFYSWQDEPTHPSRASTRPEALLDELPPLEVTVRGAAITDLLRPAYRQ